MRHSCIALVMVMMCAILHWVWWQCVPYYTGNVNVVCHIALVKVMMSVIFCYSVFMHMSVMLWWWWWWCLWYCTGDVLWWLSYCIGDGDDVCHIVVVMMMMSVILHWWWLLCLSFALVMCEDACHTALVMRGDVWHVTCIHWWCWWCLWYCTSDVWWWCLSHYTAWWWCLPYYTSDAWWCLSRCLHSLMMVMMSVILY